jgi:hypothetical protein
MLLRSLFGVGIIASGAIVVSATISPRVGDLMAVLSLCLLTIIMIVSLVRGQRPQRHH